VTESRATTATSPGPGPMFPPGRYGRRRAPRRTRRWVTGALAALTVLATVGLAGLLYQRFGVPAYDPTVVRYDEITDTGVTIDFRVHKPAGHTATCHLRSRGHEGGEVGAADVAVPTGATVEVRYRLVTTARPVTAEVTRCDPMH
jgi:hypothetical protein